VRKSSEIGVYVLFIQYTAPTSGSYELRAGCYGGNSCSGTVVFRLTPG
jgi:hypothetical protein